MDTTSVSLLERIRRDSDPAAWNRLAAIYEPWMRWILKRSALQDADAADLCQEVMATLHREIPRFQHNGQVGAFRSWLRTILMNRLRAHWRSQQASQKRVQSVDGLETMQDPIVELEELWDREHDRHVVNELLKLVEPSFTQSTWTAFRRQVVDGLQANEVARELGISVNAVLLAKSRVLRKIREEAAGLIDEE